MNRSILISYGGNGGNGGNDGEFANANRHFRVKTTVTIE